MTLVTVTHERVPLGQIAIKARGHWQNGYAHADSVHVAQ